MKISTVIKTFREGSDEMELTPFMFDTEDVISVLKVDDDFVGIHLIVGDPFEAAIKWDVMMDFYKDESIEIFHERLN